MCVCVCATNWYVFVLTASATVDIAQKAPASTSSHIAPQGSRIICDGVCPSVCVREREREREPVCLRERERERESLCACVWQPSNAFFQPTESAVHPVADLSQPPAFM